jgi:hypothetical protein
VNIAGGYNAAYGWHEKTLKKMQEARKEAARKAGLPIDILTFVLSIVAVGIGGGMVGGLIAPWAEQTGKTGIRLAKRVFRNSVKEVGGQIGEAIANAGIKVIDAAKEEPGDPYAPRVPEKIAVDQDIRQRIGSVFTPIREAVNAMIAAANETRANGAAGQAILNNFRLNCPLMTDQPGPDDIESSQEIAWRAAELAMWVAWANERDWVWWNDQFNWLVTNQVTTDRFTEAKGHVLELAPIRDRMRILGKEASIVTTLRWEAPWSSEGKDEREQREGFNRQYSFSYMDLRKLRALSLDDGNLPLRRLSGLRMQWNNKRPLDRAKFLMQHDNVAPIFK